MTVLAHLQPLGSSLTVRFAETSSAGTPNGFYQPLPVTPTVRQRAARELLNTIEEPSNLHHAVVVALESSQAGPRATARVIGLNDAQRLSAVLHHIIGHALEVIVEEINTGQLPGARGWTIGIEDGHAILDPGPDDVKSCLWVLERAVARLDEGA